MLFSRSTIPMLLNVTNVLLDFIVTPRLERRQSVLLDTIVRLEPVSTGRPVQEAHTVTQPDFSYRLSVHRVMLENIVKQNT